jgi:hypothetical protein
MPRTVRIELSGDQLAALRLQAVERGLTLEDWLGVLAGREVSAANCREIAQSAAERLGRAESGSDRPGSNEPGSDIPGQGGG